MASSSTSKSNPTAPISEIALCPSNYIKMSKEKRKEADVTSALATELNYLWTEAYAYRNMNCVTGRMVAASYARRNRYTPHAWSNVENKEITLYAGVFTPIRQSFIANMRHMIKTAVDKPFTMDIDAIPEPALYIKEKAISETIRRLQEVNPAVDDPYSVAKDAIAKQKDFAYQQLYVEAEVAAQRHERLLHDQFTDGGGHLEIERLLESYADNPTSFMLGPEYVSEETLKYNASGKVVIGMTTRYRYRNINPLDVYPTTDSIDTQNGTGVFIVERISVSELIAMAKASTPDHAKLIYEMIGDKTIRYDTKQRHSSTSTALPESVKLVTDGNQASTNIYEIVRFLGRLPISLVEPTQEELDDFGSTTFNQLGDYGKKKDAEDDAEKLFAQRRDTVACDVWILNGRVIRAQKLNYPDKKIPLFGASFRPEANQFWGTSLFDVMSTTEAASVQTNRQIVFHSGYLTHPLLWLDRSKFGDNELPSTINVGVPFVVDFTDPGSQPIGRIDLPNNLVALIGKREALLEQAERDSGVPRYMQGSTDISSAARTTGIFSALQANASKTVELHHTVIARDIIVPMMTLQYQINMMYSRDDSIKATLRPVVKGIEGLAEREARMQRFEKILQYVIPLYGVTDPATGKPVLSDTLKAAVEAGMSEYAATSNLVPTYLLNKRDKAELVQTASGESGMPLDGRNVVVQDSNVVNSVPAGPAA